MNAQRRKEIAKAISLMEQVREILDATAEEERDAYDNLPEGIQYSERGDQMEEYADTLERVCAEISDYIDELQEVIDN